MNAEPFSEKLPLDHGVCFFHCAAEFGFANPLVRTFICGAQGCRTAVFLAMTASGFGVRVILASSSELGIFSLVFSFWKSLKMVVINSFLFLLAVLDSSCSTQDLHRGVTLLSGFVRRTEECMGTLAGTRSSVVTGSMGTLVP